MSAPIYFVPGDPVRVMDADRKMAILESAGLEYIIDEEQVTVEARPVPGGGPSGTSGMAIVSHPAKHGEGEVLSPIGYFPERQTWFEPDDEAACWMGIETDHPPRPCDVIRERTVMGHGVDLNDGNRWMIPLARIFPEGTNLPTIVIPEAGGGVSYRIKEEFREISDLADSIRRAFIPSGKEDEEMILETDLSDQRVMSICMKALALNYRIGRREIKALELLTATNLKEIILALIDFPTFVAMITPKKNESMPTSEDDSPGSGS